ncbi:LruC domain-containing protein [uncultured Draconibacterium sp.]|uniref:LruC domain-containing protein n=1 Tax=uncultured Draconibacterium sp. TaxID=1573823 RepID=UPI0032604D21
MKKKSIFYMAGLLMLFFLSGCLDVDDGNTNEEEVLSIENAIIPNDFNYSTQSGVNVKLTVPEFLSNAVVSLLTYQSGQDSMRFARVSFNDAGVFESEFAVPAYIDTILAKSDYLGLTHEVIIPIVSGKAEFDYRTLYTVEKSASGFDYPAQLKSALAGTYTYLGSYNSSGVPSYLIERDIIEQNLLDDINASLPEGQRLPQSHPEYLEDGTRANIVLSKTADVWVTFVTEGAGWKNALGYYTYKTNAIPRSVDDIDELRVIFPNVSQQGSGGGLIPGDRVYLGQFEGGTVISWFLVADGWKTTEVSGGNGIHFSQAELNAETDDNLKTHMVMLYDKAREQIILGFEDVPRNWSWCDDDFNDAVFYATANPISAVHLDNVKSITAANDSDGDGINDELDDFPYDPDKSFNNFAPSEQSNGTLTFEDLWPSKGDYDFNDCVINYNFNLIANAQNLVTSIEATFEIDHIGASFQNGFGFEIPITASKIASVDGYVLNKGYVTLNNNGTEQGNSKAVVIVAENVTPLQDETVTVTINLSAPMTKTELGSVPFNPFLIANGEREREIHLADMAPTDKGSKYLGDNDDYSNPATDRYYKTDRNLPWAINIYDPFSASPEKIPIDKTYPRFLSWANSGGTLEKDWYK